MQLGTLFDEAVRALAAAYGEPADGYALPNVDAERAAFWDRGGLVVFALLALADNTRLRTLALGARKRGDLTRGAAPPADDWWARPPQ